VRELPECGPAGFVLAVNPNGPFKLRRTIAFSSRRFCQLFKQPVLTNRSSGFYNSFKAVRSAFPSVMAILHQPLSYLGTYTINSTAPHSRLGSNADAPLRARYNITLMAKSIVSIRKV